MKRILLVFSTFFFLWNSGYTQEVNFNDYIVDSVKIEHPLFKKVFPNVDFVLYTSEITMPPQQIIKGNYRDNLYSLPDDINKLFGDYESENKSVIEDKLRICLQFFFWSRLDSLKYFKDLPFEKVNYIIENRNYNYKVNFSYNGDQYEIFAQVIDDEIRYIETFINNNRKAVKSFFPSSNEKTIIISIPNIIPESSSYGDHYYVDINSTIPINQIEFVATGLSPNISVNLQVNPIYGNSGNFILDVPLITNSSGEINYPWPVSNISFTGICHVQITDNTTGSVHLMQNSYLVPENRILGTFNSGYNYTIYYCNQFMTIPGISNDFVEHVETAINDSWNKQVLDWNLSQGTLNNQPIDNDSNYEIAINDHINYYHLTNTNNAFPSNERKIGVRTDSWLTQPLYSTEEMRIKVAIAHEFYHGIQWSLNTGWGSGFWMLEGQARSIPSMQYSSEEYLENTQHFFPVSANNYITQANLNKSLLNLNYNYCIFWRFLYENYKSGNTTQKIEIIRETCDGNTSSTISGIKSFMNNKLSNGGGNYSSMDDAIKDFSKKIYFNNPTYNQWNPNPINFYDDVYLTHSLTYSGSALPVIQDAIPSSFGIDYYEIDFTTTGVVNISFNYGSNADFSVNAIIVDGTSNITDNYINITSGEGSIDLNITNTNHKVVIIVARLDANEGTVGGDYEITISPTNTFNAYFTASPSTVIQGNSVVFTDDSTGDITSWEWVFEDGDPPNHTGQTPPAINYGLDVEPGPHTATLTISDGTNSDSYPLDIIVEENTGQPIADFTANTNSSYTNVPIQFTDQSINNPTSWSWSFEPSTVVYYYETNSSSQNPIVAFTFQGYYDVSLEVSNPDGSDTETKLDFFLAYGTLLETFYPDFSPKNPEPIVYGNSISFTDLSEMYEGEIVGWIWEFEGGVPSFSFDQNPTITYPTVGIYDVNLKVYSNNSMSDPVYGNVEVYSDDFLLVHLDYNAPVPYPNCPVYFSCDVYGGLGNYKYDWVFGDGGTHTTYSPENTCTWEYQNAQIWFAYVDVQDLDVLGLSQQSEVVEVDITLQPDVTAYFEINGDILQKNEPFKVYDYSVPPDLIESWSMNFGDEGYGSLVGWGPDPIEYLTYTYEDEGLYDINLNVSTVWYPAIEDDYLKTVQVVDCNNGLTEHCDFSNLTSGWNFPIVSQELIIGGDCPLGIEPVVPSGAQVSLFAPEGIRLKDGFHVIASGESSFKAIPSCPVNYVENSMVNSIVANDFGKTGFIQPQEEPGSINSIVDDFNENHGCDIYPNPTNNLLNIYFTKEEEGLMEIELKDAMGKTVYSYTGKMEKHTVIDLSNYQKGIYLLKVKTAGIASVQKVIRQ